MNQSQFYRKAGQMRDTVIIAICLMIPSSLTAQSAGTDIKAQKEVVEQFVKLETEGERISPEGWQQARRLFVRSSPFSQWPKVFVIGKRYTVWDPMTIPPGTITVSVEIDPVGQIDSKLRFTAPAGSYYKNSRYFKLLLTEKRWELGPNGEADKEVSESSSRWLIDAPNDTLMLTVSTAIRYVTEARDRANDPVIKKNAEEALTKLTKLH